MNKLLLAMAAAVIIPTLAISASFSSTHIKTDALGIKIQKHLAKKSHYGLQSTVAKTVLNPTATNDNLQIDNMALQAKSKALTGIDIKKLTTVAESQGIKPKALKAALNSYVWASEHGKLGSNKRMLTVVDFTLPSYQKRMWVIDLQAAKVLMSLYTTHGKGSGNAYATHFSNRGNTDTSSLGLYVTSDEYYGRHDKSMRIDGLEQGVNDNARSRNIVIHAAAYATPEYIKSHHAAGRSWGCFAVAPSVKDQLLNYIKGGSVLFTYAAAEDHDPIVSNGPITTL